jgi:hypothetical protein
MAKDTTTKRSTAAKAIAAAKPRAKRTTTARASRRGAAPASATAPITHEQIALRAYEIHLAGVEGDAMAHWLRAERELVGA